MWFVFGIFFLVLAFLIKKKTYQLESPRFVSSFHVVEAFTPGELVLQAREAEGGGLVVGWELGWMVQVQSNIAEKLGGESNLDDDVTFWYNKCR